MLWWFLILGVSTVVVVSVAVLLYMRVRRQMKNAATQSTEQKPLDRRSSSPEA